MQNDRLASALQQIREIAEQALGGTAATSKSSNERKKRAPIKLDSTPSSAKSLSFSLNARAFMKRYGKGLSGSQKFTLLAAYLAKGKPGAQISSDQIVAEWDRMTSILGGTFNHAHATRAKESGWIDSPKRGIYLLSSTWKEALGAE
jgi:hypothetical protein